MALKGRMVIRVLLGAVGAALVAYLWVLPVTLPMTPGFVADNLQGPLSSETPTMQAIRVPEDQLAGLFFPVLVGAPEGTSETLEVEAHIESSEAAVWSGPVDVVSLGGRYQGIPIQFDPIVDSADRMLELSFRPAPDARSPLFLATVRRQGLAAGPLRIGDVESYHDIELSLQLLQSSTFGSVAGASLRTRPHTVAVAIALAGVVVCVLWMLSGRVWLVDRLRRIDRLLLGIALTAAIATATVTWWF